MVGSAAIKQGRSANRKHTYFFFFWPNNRLETNQMVFQFEGLRLIPWVDLKGWVDAKIQLFRIWSLCSHIKFKEMKRTATFKQIFYYQPLGLDKKVKIFFSESGHFAYEIKGNERYNNMQANILPSHTPWTTRAW